MHGLSGGVMTPLRVRFLLVILAIAARVIAAAWLGDSFYFVDEVDYADAAEHLQAGQGFGVPYQRVPGYPLLLAVFAAMLGGKLVLLRLAQAVLVGAGCWLVHSLACRFVGNAPALIASLLYALDPLLVVTGALLFPESASALLFLATIFLVDRAAEEDALGASAAAALMLGVLAQFRPVALVAIPVSALWVAFALRTRSSRPPLRRVLHAAVVVALSVLTLLPWTYRNFQVHGKLIPIATAGTRNASVPPDEVERRGVAGAMLRKLLTEPRPMIVGTTQRFVYFWELYPTRLAVDDAVQRSKLHAGEPRLPEQEMFHRGLRDSVSGVCSSIEFLLALVGVVFLWRADRRRAALLLGVIFSFALGYALFVVKLRYRVPVMPLVFLFSGVGASVIWSLLSRRRLPSGRFQTASERPRNSSSRRFSEP